MRNVSLNVNKAAFSRYIYPHWAGSTITQTGYYARNSPLTVLIIDSGLRSKRSDSRSWTKPNGSGGPLGPDACLYPSIHSTIS